MITVITLIQLPASTPRAYIDQQIEKSIPLYQKVPGLLRKAFIVSAENVIGGTYLFDTRASAEAQFDKSWFDGVRKAFHVEGKVMYFDTPVYLDNSNRKVLRDPPTAKK